ncbi:MAG: tetratricopeptide repeat protein, partial [Melioribacteraceae bacterium]|nr:tetratricopeptide repeat protein [Melioribacteraceae bacterium]
MGFLRREEPNNTSVLFAIGESYRAMSNSLFASNAYQNVLVKDSTNIMARIELGKLYMKMKDYSRAKDSFQYLVSLDSTNAYYLRQYGFSLYKLGELKKAVKQLITAISLNDFDPKAPLWLAKIYFDQEKYKDALKIIKRSILLHSIDLPLNKLAAEIYFKMKRYKSATVQYYNVIILGDSSSVVYQKLGLSLYSSVATRDFLSENEKEEKLLEAVEALEKSHAKDKFNNSLTLTYLGFCYKVLKEYDKSIFYLEEALNAMIPEYIDKTYSTLGASYELSENYHEAIIAYSKSLEYSHENPSTIFRLATLYDRYYADKSVALAHYEKYLRINGNENNEFSK